MMTSIDLLLPRGWATSSRFLEGRAHNVCKVLEKYTVMLFGTSSYNIKIINYYVQEMSPQAPR